MLAVRKCVEDREHRAAGFVLTSTAEQADPALVELVQMQLHRRMAAAELGERGADEPAERREERRHQDRPTGFFGATGRRS